MQPRADGGESVHLTPNLELPEEAAEEEPAVATAVDDDVADATAEAVLAVVDSAVEDEAAVAAPVEDAATGRSRG